MAAQKKLGEILVAAGVIDQFQLRSALGEQQRWGGRLGITLIKLGFLDERDLVRALAGQLDLPVAHLEGKRIQPEVLDLVPIDVAERAMCIPLFLREDQGRRTLFLGMEDPCDLQVMDEIRFRTGMMVKPVLMGPSEICEGIDRFYHRRNRGSEALELTESPAPAVLARTHREPEPSPESVLVPAPSAGGRAELPGVAVDPVAWLAAVVETLVERGIATREELETRVRAHLGGAAPGSDDERGS